MTEQDYKKVFKHRHVTNVEIDQSKTYLVIAIRYKDIKSMREMRKFVEQKAKQFSNLRYTHIIFGDSTENYDYSIIRYKFI